MTSDKKTYRVKGIPATLTKEDSRIFLTSILQELNENSELTVHSLGADPYSSERNTFQIATVTFQQVPRCLQDGKDQWTLPTTNPNDTTVVSSITVDSHFSGFTPLNSVKDGSGHEIDCIAITGLGSHPFGSWKERKGHHMWLRDGLPHDLKGARVLVYGYNTNLLESQTFQRVDDIASAFGKSIRSIRIHNKGEVMPRPLVFISHSLGGVILKRAIVEMKGGDETDKENFNSIYGVLFFGVPNQGIRIEHWLAMVEGQPNENLIRDLGPDSTYLGRLHEDFRTAFTFSDSKIVFIYETERTRVAKKEESGKWAMTGNYEILVPVNSATDSRYRNLPMQRNHSDLVKFSSRWDDNYKLIVSSLEEFSMDAVEVIRRRFSKTQGKVQLLSEGGLWRLHDNPLLNHLADRNTNREPTDNGGWTPLHHAAFRGNENSLNELGVVSVNVETKDANGRTPLHIAAYYGRDAVAKTLLGNGANKDAKNYSGQTPLYNAASRGYASTVEILVGGKADMEARDNEEKTPLYAAARYGHDAVARLLVEKGANKEAKGKGGWTPLHAAAWYGHETVVRLLVESSTDMESRSQDGQTPLHAAVQNGHEAAVRQLLESGADKMARTAAGETPLLVAARHGRDPVARLLVDKGSDKEARDRDGNTPLYAAAKAGHEKVTRLLLDKGAKKQVKALGGWTPLHAAAWYGRESTSKALVEYGANMESRSQDGETPLFVAARHGHEAVVRLLVENGAYKKAQTDRGWTPLRVAESNEHRGVARFLRNS